MKFQERLRALISEEKQKEADEVFAQMDSTFSRYDDDIRGLKERLRAREGIDPKEFERLEGENERLQIELSTLKAAQKDGEKTSKTLSEKLAGVTDRLHRTLKETELRKAMSEYRFDPEAQNEVFGLLSASLNLQVLEDSAGTRVSAKITKDGKDAELGVGDAVKQWVETSPLAKRVIIAGKTSGTGSAGSGVVGGQRKKWSEMSLKEQSELFRADPDTAKQLMKE